ncbi:MAG: hypothetical protein ACRC1K_17475 [Planctomycetia bacterium]
MNDGAEKSNFAAVVRKLKSLGMYDCCTDEQMKHVEAVSASTSIDDSQYFDLEIECAQRAMDFSAETISEYGPFVYLEKLRYILSGRGISLDSIEDTHFWEQEYHSWDQDWIVKMNGLSTMLMRGSEGVEISDYGVSCELAACRFFALVNQLLSASCQDRIYLSLDYGDCRAVLLTDEMYKVLRETCGLDWHLRRLRPVDELMEELLKKAAAKKRSEPETS